MLWKEATFGLIRGRASTHRTADEKRTNQACRAYSKASVQEHLGEKRRMATPPEPRARIEVYVVRMGNRTHTRSSGLRTVAQGVAQGALCEAHPKAQDRGALGSP